MVAILKAIRLMYVDQACSLDIFPAITGQWICPNIEFFGILRAPQFRQKAMRKDFVIVLSTEPVIKSWTGRNKSAINYQASALHTPIR